ncbi:uncharacterized protein LAESUDRAFT_727018 [Laetiporus sulphureus 93-53]|uniref:Uncharacterized protein n=1 Tax=Laetiporus sulphureus 93-53 TaxID=1314785 RepID=A0A165DQ39_9APHY|nr:uncharacterized protein LAESUDRAFT_727018 [Laetiporus sulphureus 93-53]KZT05377.1 hypothetical protein LAESUDRAFT_727018 [Laetiporus sulphureus 93-53]
MCDGWICGGQPEYTSVIHAKHDSTIHNFHSFHEVHPLSPIYGVQVPGTLAFLLCTA